MHASAMVLAASLSTAASAGSITAKITSYTNGYTASYNDGNTATDNWSVRGGAGVFEWQKVSGDPDEQVVMNPDGETFYTFCIEVVEHVRTNTNYTYDLVDPALAPERNRDLPAMGSAAADLLAQWYGTYYQGVMDSNNTDQVQAFQIGVWEIVYETIAGGSTLDNKNGAFKASANGATNLAQSWLTSSTWQTDGETLALIAMTNNGRQDQLVVATPSPVAFVPGALGMMFLASRRRRRAAE
jgi:hypothetical protein